jgi:TRAP-type C4-dicarboxylate transport system permease small subunit
MQGTERKEITKVTSAATNVFNIFFAGVMALGCWIGAWNMFATAREASRTGIIEVTKGKNNYSTEVLSRVTNPVNFDSTVHFRHTGGWVFSFLAAFMTLLFFFALYVYAKGKRAPPNGC